MNAKQRNAIYRNNRLNYLIDSYVDPEEIHKIMRGKLSLQFIKNIIAKRMRK